MREIRNVRFDERGVEERSYGRATKAHRQTKGAETDMLSLTSPRHTPTLPIRDIE